MLPGGNIDHAFVVIHRLLAIRAHSCIHTAQPQLAAQLREESKKEVFFLSRRARGEEDTVPDTVPAWADALHRQHRKSGRLGECPARSSSRFQRQKHRHASPSFPCLLKTLRSPHARAPEAACTLVHTGAEPAQDRDANSPSDRKPGTRPRGPTERGSLAGPGPKLTVCF